MQTRICRPLVIILLAGLVLSQTACGRDEPTESDMFQAMAAADRHRKIFGDIEKIKTKLEKSGCEKVESNACKCGFVWKNGKGRAFPLILFIKADKKWEVAM